MLVGHAEQHPLGQPGLADEGLQRLGETVAVRDLAVADQSGRQLEARAAHQATGVHLCGGEVATIDVETYDTTI